MIAHTTVLTFHVSLTDFVQRVCMFLLQLILSLSSSGNFPSMDTTSSPSLIGRNWDKNTRNCQKLMVGITVWLHMQEACQ